MKPSSRADRVQLPLQEYDVDRIVQAYRAAISPRTRVISVSHVLASTGLTMPIAEIRSPHLTCRSSQRAWRNVQRLGGGDVVYFPESMRRRVRRAS